MASSTRPSRPPHATHPRGIVIRPAEPADAPRLGVLAARLVRFHHELDASRFLLVEPIEQGYARWLGKEMKEKEAVVLVALREAREGAGDGGDEIVGYAYGRLEPRNWNDLLDACGKLHDVYVDDSARKRGVGEALVRDVCARLALLGAPRTLLLTASQNRGAQALFAKLGFRSTMIEMTRERDGERPEVGDLEDDAG